MPPPPPSPSAAQLSPAPCGSPLPGSGSSTAGRGIRGHLRAVPDVASVDFDAAVRTLGPRLQRYATRRLGDRHEAEELVQEALLRAYQHRDELRTEDDLAAWSTCVTGRLVIDRLRVRGRSTPFAEVPEGVRAERDTADIVVARDQARTALDALDAMPPRQAAVLWAREVEGLNYDAIGERFAMSEPAVRSLLTRARKALRKEYATRGGTLPSAGLALLAPWVTGTGWLERLREGLGRTPGLAALGVAGVGLVTGALLSPFSPATADPTPIDVVTQVGVPDAGSAPLVVAPAAAAASGTQAAAPAGSSAAPPPAPAAPAPRAQTPLERTGLDGTCVAVGDAGAGGADCAQEPEQSELTVQLPVDTSAAGVELPAVSTERVPCRTLPDLPMTECSSPGEPQ